MKRRHSITCKITGMLLILSLTSLLFAGAVSAGSLYFMKTVSEVNNRELGKTAAEDTEQALEAAAGEQLLGIASGKAAYIEEKFNAIMTYVHGIAAQAEAIYGNPGGYPDREVALPIKGSCQLAAQLLHSERLASPTKEQEEELLKLGNMQDLLVQYNANNDMVSSTYLATVSGWMIQADYIADRKYAGDMEEPLPYEAWDRQWFRRARKAKQGQIVYSDVMEDFHEGGDCIVCAQPVYKEGEVVAVAGLGFYLDTVKEAVLGTTIGESGYAFLVNQDGDVAVSPKTEGETAAHAGGGGVLCQNPEAAEAVESVLHGEKGLKKLSLDGKQVYLAYAPLKNLGWGFMTVMDVEEVIAPAVAGQNQILALSSAVAKRQNNAIGATLLYFMIILILTGIAVAAAGMLLGRRIAKPIRCLTADVAKIGAGNLDYRIKVSTGDEVEALGNAFNAMTGKMQEYIGNLAAVTAEKERIRTELEVAARIQKDMLPDTGEFRGCPSFYLDASMTPAKEVGGDFYDFFFLDEDRLAVIVADVSGKGVPAALFMAMAKSRLRACLASEKSLEKAMEKANDSLCADNKNGMFVTVWAGILTLSDGRLTYVNAGHCKPLVKYRDGGFFYLEEQGNFVLAGMERMQYRESSVFLSPGDMLFQYSDGVVEANDEMGRFYGESRLQEFLNGREQKAEQLIASVWADLQGFQGKAEQFDDITMLLLSYKGSKRGNPYQVPAEPGRLLEICDFIEDKMKEENLPEDIRLKILVAADEVLSNIFRYSNAALVEVSCHIQDGQVEVCFFDDGTPYNPLKRKAPDICKSAAERTVGGLGIYIVRQIMDEVRYEYESERKRNRLVIVKKYP